MKSQLKLTPTYQQTFHLNASMQNQLEILSMDSRSLIDHLSNLSLTNPFLEYTPHEEITDYFSHQSTQGPSLKEELYFQLHTCQQHYNETIASYIIESLDTHGFFSLTDQQACQDLHISQEKLLEHLTLIQSFEPAGVAARNSIDSILIQLNRKELHTAAYLLMHFQAEIIDHQLDAISEKTNLSMETIKTALSQIQNCDPWPCSSWSTETTQWILPDLEIKVIDDDIHIEPRQTGKLCLMNPKERMTDPVLKEYLNQAKYTIDSLNKRNQSLLVIANEIVLHQQGFFLYADELKPLTLKEISEKTGFTQSTISRTVSNKYYLYQDELYPLRSLFTSKTRKGSSKDAIQKALIDIIHEEDPKNPYQDEELVALLKELELFASRRTVAKYRNQLKIPNSKQRKKANRK